MHVTGNAAQTGHATSSVVVIGSTGIGTRNDAVRAGYRR